MNRLRRQLNELDKATSDILHQLEAYPSLSASQGFKYARILKDIREERRRIKNQLEEFQLLLRKLNEIKLNSIKKTLIDLETLQEKRIYTPRILTPDKYEKRLSII